MPPTATTQGTERSIWPSRMTIIMPVAMTPRKEATLSCCSRYSGDRKFGRVEAAEEQQHEDAAEGGRRPPGRCGGRPTAAAGLDRRLSMVIGVYPNRSRRLRIWKSRDRAEADRDEQHEALEQRLPQRLEVEDEEQVADGAEGEGAEDRADGAARRRRTATRRRAPPRRSSRACRCRRWRRRLRRNR